MTAITINGVDVGSTYGWYPDGLPGWLSAPTQRITTASVPARPGVVATRTDQNAPRMFGISGTIRKDTVALRKAAERSLTRLAYDGLVTIAVDDGTTPAVQVAGYVQGFQINPFTPSLSPLASRLEATFLCPVPYWLASSNTTVTLAVAGTYYDVALGNAKTYPVITLTDCTNPIITYRDSAGTPVHVIALSANGGVSVTSPDVVTITMTLGANGIPYGNITKTVSGVTTSIISTLVVTTGNFPFALDPNDGDFDTSDWPDIRTHSGTGTVVYPKAFL